MPWLYIPSTQIRAHIHTNTHTHAHLLSNAHPFVSDKARWALQQELKVLCCAEGLCSYPAGRLYFPLGTQLNHSISITFSPSHPLCPLYFKKQKCSVTRCVPVARPHTVVWIVATESNESNGSVFFICDIKDTCLISAHRLYMDQNITAYRFIWWTMTH